MTSTSHKKSLTIQTYNQSARALAEKFNTIGPRTSDIAEVLDLLHKENPFILEIGCGNGRDAQEILKYTNHYIGMDVSGELITLAQEKNPDGMFVVADIEEYEFPKNLDAIIAFASLIHSPKEQLHKIFAQALEALNPGGLFRISLKHADQYSEITQTDRFGTRTYYYYSENDIHECAQGYLTISSELRPIPSQETTWLEMLLQKPIVA